MHTIRLHGKTPHPAFCKRGQPESIQDERGFGRSRLGKDPFNGFTVTIKNPEPGCASIVTLTEIAKKNPPSAAVEEVGPPRGHGFGDSTGGLRKVVSRFWRCRMSVVLYQERILVMTLPMTWTGSAREGRRKEIRPICESYPMDSRYRSYLGLYMRMGPCRCLR